MKNANYPPLCLLSLTLLAVAAIRVESALAQTQNDFDNDGLSDRVQITSSSNEIVWSHLDTTTASLTPTPTPSTQNFGITTDTPALAHWLSTDYPSFAYVRAESAKDALTWSVFVDPGTQKDKQLGHHGDVIVSGGDFDGDGLSDAAVVRPTNSNLTWNVKTRFFSQSAVLRRFTFGQVGDRVFFVNPDGVRDWVGVFGPSSNKKKARLSIRDVVTGRTRTYRTFSLGLAQGLRPRPFPIKNLAGSDYIGFEIPSVSSTTLRVYTIKGRLVSKHTFPGLGTMVVGNYDETDPDEEILFKSSNSTVVFNPTTEGVTVVTSYSGTPVDEINVVQVGASVPTQTPTTTPTKTPTRSPTPTPNS